MLHKFSLTLIRADELIFATYAMWNDLVFYTRKKLRENRSYVITKSYIKHDRTYPEP